MDRRLILLGAVALFLLLSYWFLYGYSERTVIPLYGYVHRTYSFTYDFNQDIFSHTTKYGFTFADNDYNMDFVAWGFTSNGTLYVCRYLSSTNDSRCAELSLPIETTGTPVGVQYWQSAVAGRYLYIAYTSYSRYYTSLGDLYRYYGYRIYAINLLNLTPISLVYRQYTGFRDSDGIPDYDYTVYPGVVFAVTTFPGSAQALFRARVQYFADYGTTEEEYTDFVYDGFNNTTNYTSTYPWQILRAYYSYYDGYDTTGYSTEILFLSRFYGGALVRFVRNFGASYPTTGDLYIGPNQYTVDFGPYCDSPATRYFRGGYDFFTFCDGNYVMYFQDVLDGNIVAYPVNPPSLLSGFLPRDYYDGNAVRAYYAYFATSSKPLTYLSDFPFKVPPGVYISNSGIGEYHACSYSLDTNSYSCTVYRAPPQAYILELNVLAPLSFDENVYSVPVSLVLKPVKPDVNQDWYFVTFVDQNTRYDFNTLEYTFYMSQYGDHNLDLFVVRPDYNLESLPESTSYYVFQHLHTTFHVRAKPWALTLYYILDRNFVLYLSASAIDDDVNDPRALDYNIHVRLYKQGTYVDYEFNEPFARVDANGYVYAKVCLTVTDPTDLSTTKCALIDTLKPVTHQPVMLFGPPQEVPVPQRHVVLVEMPVSNFATLGLDVAISQSPAFSALTAVLAVALLSLPFILYWFFLR